MDKAIKTRLTILSFLQWASWGAYLTSMGSFLAKEGFADKIGFVYSIQGIVSLFMPALMGIVADRFLKPRNTYALCHLICGLSLLAAGLYAVLHSGSMIFPIWLTLYSIAICFFMPTVSMSYSVSYALLEKNGFDSTSTFPSVRMWGTVGFITAMLASNWLKDNNGLSFQYSGAQFIFSGCISLLLVCYRAVLPDTVRTTEKIGMQRRSFAERSGLDAFKMFKDRRMAVFFIFCALVGVALQITNSYANPFISSFASNPAFRGCWGTNNPNALIAIGQISETLCILMIPFALKRFGIRNVILIALFAWFLRFGLFGLGNPGDRLWMLVLSCMVYGVAFDFFNISATLYINENTEERQRHSAQGLYLLMTNGIGATVGTLSAQGVVNTTVYHSANPSWSIAWFIFAGYALVVGILFLISFQLEPSR